jgi:membrane associated rhomboid family serine protease
MRRRENLHTLYVLLFLNIAFFFLQLQDSEKYFRLFSFDSGRFLAGEFWRILSFQFVQGGSLFGGPAISLFFSLLILYIMGAPLEEEWGSLDFVLFFVISTLGSAAAAFLFHLPPLLGSFALTYSLLFAYATTYPQQTFLIFFILPVRVTWLAWLSLGLLLLGLIGRSPESIAAAAGAAASYAWFMARTGRVRTLRMGRARTLPSAVPSKPLPTAVHAADRNLRRFADMKEAIASGSPAKVDALAGGIAPEIVPGVNICPPADYKPQGEDRYCVRCEGFAECSVRYLKMNRPAEDAETSAHS